MMRAGATSWAALTLVLGGLVGACGGPAQDSGTNTNWLRLCAEDADCEGAGDCLCERCTVECNSDADCPQGTVCSTLGSASLQCNGEPTTTCQPECSLDRDCGRGRVCYEGSCADSLPSPSCPVGALFCDDFEADAGYDFETAVTDGNTHERVAAPAPSGSRLSRATIAQAPSTAYHRTTLPMQTSGEIFMSAWVHVPQEPEHDVSPLALWGSGDQAWALRFVLRNGGLELWTGTTAHTGPHPLQLGAWACLQARVSVGDAGVAELFADGQSLAIVEDLDTLPVGGVDGVAWGAVWGGTPAVIEVDRVIVSTTPVSCTD